MSLRDRLIARIAAEGPMSVADYMTACLHDPADGYYATRPRLGEDGDFITAPHVSQMFGELLGLWAAEAWERLGRPRRVRLVEMGPGDGTMMSDMLRAARLAPGFLEAAEVWLVETSPPLRARQESTLREADPRWVEDCADIPDDAPVILVANEVLDCLPIEQWVSTPAGWAQRRVDADGADRLRFVTADSLPETGAIRETSERLAEVGRALGGLIARASGAALFVDYGRDAPGLGNTLQALRDHRKEHPLANPGLADLTAHVDFPAFLAAAREAGAKTPAIRAQGDFLRALGLDARAAALSRAHPDQAGKIARQVRRLTGAEAMGDLFKVACLHSPGLTAPGFEGP